MAKAKQLVIESPEVDSLITILEEATRSTKEGAKYFLEPAQGTLSRGLSRRHHIIFGRRGSGKSSLLNKLLNDFNVSRRPVAYVDLEAFKGHSYPDVLVSILIKTLSTYKHWLETTAIYPSSKKTWWRKFWGSIPSVPSLNKSASNALSARIEAFILELNDILMSPDSAERLLKSNSAKTQANELSGDLKIALGPSVSAGISTRESETRAVSTEISDAYKSHKIEFIHRMIVDYKKLFEDLSLFSNGPSYLLLDDLYHIRTDDQANVVDYFHRILKNTDTWLKIGTIRHRTLWYIPGRPPTGIKLGDDADEIDLDVTLDKYSLTKIFLLKILEQFCREADVRVSDLLTDGARDRLVLASGGVARDFLSLVRKSIEIARQRLASGDNFRGDRISTEDVNKAAGELDSFKQEDFVKDTEQEERDTLTSFFAEVRDFCLEKTSSNCILVSKMSRGKRVDMIKELVDLKFMHHVRGRVTVRDKPGNIFDAYMLDISQYSGEQKRRKFDIIEFWEGSGEDKLRKTKLIFSA